MSVHAEPTAEGLKIYENPVGVLTNNPPFPMQLSKLNDYLNLTPYEPTSRFSENLQLTAYSRGMGALGLPGDSSSASRFARAVFARANIVSGESEEEKVGAFFHMLDLQRGRDPRRRPASDGFGGYHARVLPPRKHADDQIR